MSADKIVLLTGGSGTLGHALIPLLQSRPDVGKIIVLARGEHRLVETVAKFSHPDLPLIDYALADVREPTRLDAVNTQHHPQWVIHAAALKRIEVGEREPEEFMRTNAFGTANAVYAFRGCEKFMFISSDKAVAPINAYGRSKALAENVVLSQNGRNGTGPGKYSVARYGNIAGSRGSVVELWARQKAAGIPFTITRPDMTRFWWPVIAAARYVLARMDEMEGGEIFVPRLKAASILEMLQALHGEDAKYEVIAMRPGEKLHEVMCVEDETAVRKLPGIFSSDKAPHLTTQEIRELMK